MTATIPHSGGHLNPAVTLVMLMTKRIKFLDAFFYWVSQLIAAFTAASLVKVSMGGELLSGTPTISEKMRTVAVVDMQAAMNTMALEAVVTFFLVVVFFATVVDKSAPKTGGLFIGAVVTMGIIAVGPMTGAAMNPARWFGPAFVSGEFATSSFTLSNLFTAYVAGPALGAIVAALIYQYVFMGRDQLPDPSS